MKRKLSGFLFFGVISTCVIAQSSGGDFVISSQTIDGGGARSSGGDFVITGTIGQFDASTNMKSGGSYVHASGFWANAREEVFVHGFETP